METARPKFSVHVRTGWVDYSPALHWHASQKLSSALAGFASRIRAVHVRIVSEEAHAPGGRRCEIEVIMNPAGTILASSSGSDVQDLVDRATESVLAQLREQGDAERLSRIA